MKYLLPAFALFWLAMIYASTLAGHEYVVATLSLPSAKTAIVGHVPPDAQRFGLRPGMRVDLTRMPLSERIRFWYGTLKGTQLRLPVVAGQTIQTLVVPALQLRAAVPTTLRVFNLVAMTFALLLAAFLAYRKPGVMVAALILYLGGGALSWPAFVIFFSGLPDQLYVPMAVMLSALCDWFPVLVLAAFAVRFPEDNPVPQKRTAIRIIDGIVVLGFITALMTDLLYGNRNTYVTFTALSGLVVIAASLVALRYAKSSDRARVGLVFAAVMIGGVGYAANMIWLQYGGIFVVFALYANLSVVVVPLAVAYAMVRHRVFDIAFVLNRTLIYAITSTVVLVALAAMEFAAERWLSELTRVEGIAVQFGIALVVIVSVRAIHSRVDRAVDGLLFRTRHEQESALRRFATTLQFYTEQAPVVRDPLRSSFVSRACKVRRFIYPTRSGSTARRRRFRFAHRRSTRTIPRTSNFARITKSCRFTDSRRAFSAPVCIRWFLQAGSWASYPRANARAASRCLPISMTLSGAWRPPLRFLWQPSSPTASARRMPYCRPGWRVPPFRV
ncbi:MAG TPA: hypothetical protein VKT72_11805 [Candidatus Baltobacteraceae bacterium]|nr:hypothetical protein [Candidatus Baltobacteraceae bacterium]